MRRVLAAAIANILRFPAVQKNVRDRRELFCMTVGITLIRGIAEERALVQRIASSTSVTEVHDVVSLQAVEVQCILNKCTKMTCVVVSHTSAPYPSPAQIAPQPEIYIR